MWTAAAGRRFGFVKREEIIMVAWVAQGVAHFQEDAIRGDHALPSAAMLDDRLPVGWVFVIEQGQEMEAVRKDRLHVFFGWPFP